MVWRWHAVQEILDDLECTKVVRTTDRGEPFGTMESVNFPRSLPRSIYCPRNSRINHNAVSRFLRETPAIEKDRVMSHTSEERKGLHTKQDRTWLALNSTAAQTTRLHRAKTLWQNPKQTQPLDSQMSRRDPNHSLDKDLSPSTRTSDAKQPVSWVDTA
jgi:hypothetical protein